VNPIPTPAANATIDTATADSSAATPVTRKSYALG